MKCASSAEADVFVQAVTLFIAVISPIARRCDLHDRFLLRAATTAFATRLWAIQVKRVIRERPHTDTYPAKIFCSFPAKSLFRSTIICTFVAANDVDKELLMFTQIAENFKLLYVTYS